MVVGFVGTLGSNGKLSGVGGDAKVLYGFGPAVVVDDPLGCGSHAGQIARNVLKTNCQELDQYGRRCDAQDGDRGSGGIYGSGKGDGRASGGAAADGVPPRWRESGGLCGN